MVNHHYDLIIIGGGPAGLTAAIYGGRAKLKTLVINTGTVGGLVNTTREIVNYPGYEKISGSDLMLDFKKHAEAFGVEFLRGEVVCADLSKDDKVIKTKKGQVFTAKAVILGCGSEPRHLNVPGEKRLRGSGVAYCATCDAQFFEGEDVVVVGSGDQAIEEGMYITKFARIVTVIVLHDEGVLDCNKVSAERAFQNEKMEFVWNSTVEEVLGEESVKGVIIKNLRTGSPTTLSCQGIFFFVGMVPSTQFLKESGLEMDKSGYIPVNNLMETNLPGVYAIGDSRVKYLRQVVTAAGDGATAAVAAERYIEEMDAFRNSIVNSEKKVLLVFFNAKDTDSLEFCSCLEEVAKGYKGDYKLVKVDMATKKSLAEKYGIANVPTVLVVDKGQKVKELKLEYKCSCIDKAALIAQLK